MHRLKKFWIELTKKFWIIFAVVVALLVSLFTYSLDFPSKGEGILYLLSSVSQGLAAIFTLVLTITIFGAQMMRKFTAMDKMIDKWTIRLMIIFAIGIILPLIQLRTDEDLLNLNFIRTANLSIAIDLGIATFCVFSIIPFLMRVNSIMKYEGGISKLREEASEAIDSNHRVTASTRINELVELGESAAEDMLESEVKKIVTVLKSLEIGNLKKTEDSIDVIKCVTFGDYLEEVSKVVWKNLIFETIYGLQKIGKKCAEKNLDIATMEVLDALKEIAIRATIGKATDKQSDRFNDITVDIVIRSMAVLTQIGIVAIERDLSNNTILSSPNSLFEIGIKVLNVSKKSKTFNLSDRWMMLDVKDNLEKIADKVYEKNKSKYENIYESSLVFLWILGARLNSIPIEDNDIASVFKKSDKSVMKEFGNERIRMMTRKYIKEKYSTLQILESELNAFEGLYDSS